MVWREIQSAFHGGELAFFMGAGVSRPAPSLLPTADEIRHAVFLRLKEEGHEAPAQLDRAEAYLDVMPFELLMSALEQVIGDDIFAILGVLRGGTPNEIHRYVARLLRDRKIKLVLTTNFDNLLEQALGDELSGVRVCWSAEELVEIASYRRDTDPPAILKLHGTLETPGGGDGSESVRTTVTRITSGMSPEVASALRGIFDQHLTVFLGYSGRDRQDILPLLLTARDARMVWVDHHPGSGGLPLEPLSDHEVPSPSTSREAALVILADPDRRCMFRCDTNSFLELFGGCMWDHYGGKDSSEQVCGTGTEGSDVVPVASGLFGDRADIVAGRLLLLPRGFMKEAADCFRAYIANHKRERGEHLAKAYQGQGQAVETDGHLEEAIRCYSQAVDIWWSLGKELEVAETLNDLGIVYAKKSKMRHVAEARECYEQALELARAIHAPGVLGMTYHNLGTLYERARDFEAARKHYSEAVKQKRAAGDALNEILSLEGLGNVSKGSSLARDCHLRILEVIWKCGLTEESLITKTLFALANEVRVTEGQGWERFVDSNATLRITGFWQELKQYLSFMTESQDEPKRG